MAEFRTSSLFTERERAALAFVEAAVRDRRVSEEIVAKVRTHFSDAGIVELAWGAAAETYFNVRAHALGIGSDKLLGLAKASGHEPLGGSSA